MYYIEVLIDGHRHRIHIDESDHTEMIVTQLRKLGYVCETGPATVEDALRRECPVAVRDHCLNRVFVPGLKK